MRIQSSSSKGELEIGTEQWATNKTKSSQDHVLSREIKINILCE